MSQPWSNAEVQAFLYLLADENIQRELDGAKRNEKIFQEVSAQMTAQGFHRTPKQIRGKLKKLKSDYKTIKDHNGRSGADRRSWKWFDQMDAIYGKRPANNGRESGLDTATVLLEFIADESVPEDEGSLDSVLDSPSLPASNPSPTTSAPSTSTSTPPGNTQQSSTTQHPLLGNRKRKATGAAESFLTAHTKQEEKNRAQREEHFRFICEDAKKAREDAAAERQLQRQEDAAERQLQRQEDAAERQRQAAAAREQEEAILREEIALRREEAELRREEAAQRRQDAEQRAAFNQALLGVLESIARSMANR